MKYRWKGQDGLRKAKQSRTDQWRGLKNLYRKGWRDQSILDWRKQRCDTVSMMSHDMITYGVVLYKLLLSLSLSSSPSEEPENFKLISERKIGTVGRDRDRETCKQ